MEKNPNFVKKIDVNSQSVIRSLIAVGSREIEGINSVEYYNSRTNVWSKILDIDVDRYFYMNILLEGKLMYVGGSKGGIRSSSVESYDFSTGKLETLASMKQRRYTHAVAVLSHYLFAIGGQDVGVLGSVEMYNPITNEWTDVVPMLTPRYDCSADVLDGEIYVVGGVDSNGMITHSVESYNPISGTWKRCTNMNEKRDYTEVTAIDSFLYAIGGHNGVHRTNTVERYEPLIDRWIYVETMSIPRSACASVNHNGFMIVAGGFDSDSNVISLVESYDDEDNSWTTIAPLLYPRAYFSLVEVPWELLKQAIDLKNEKKNILISQ